MGFHVHFQFHFVLFINHLKWFLWKNDQLLIQLKRCEDEVKSEKCVVEAKDAEMETLR